MFDIWVQFDSSFLAVMLMCNFSQGFKQFLDLSLLTLYKDVLKVEPAETQAFMGIIAIPWSLKIVYGFISDNVEIFHSKRRGHIIMNTSVSMLSMLAIILMGENSDKIFVTVCIFISQICMAYNDTVIDALTIQASQQGVKNGNQNLNSWSFIMQALGAISGGLMAEFINLEHVLGPFKVFSVYLVLQLMFLVAAIYMNDSMEPV
jgi:hypothetical protein